LVRAPKKLIFAFDMPPVVFSPEIYKKMRAISWEIALL
jgi:hypothetical protein